MDRVTASSSGGAASTFVVRLYLSTNMTFGDSDDVTAGERVVSNLFPGQYSAGNLLVPAGLVPPGYYFAFAVADADQAVAESDETNNRRLSLTRAYVAQ